MELAEPRFVIQAQSVSDTKEVVQRSQQSIAHMQGLIDQTQQRIDDSLTRLQEPLPIETDPPL